MAEDKYQFGVGWVVSALPHSLYVQGMLQHFEGRPTPMDARLPMTHNIRHGLNQIKVASWPQAYTPEDEIRLSVLYWLPGQNPNTEAATAFKVVIMPGRPSAVPEILRRSEDAPLWIRDMNANWSTGTNFDTLSIKFENRQDTPLWCWEQGEVLDDNDATRDSLAAEYKRLYGVLATGDNDAVVDEYATATRDLVTASGLSEGYVRNRTGFQMFFENPDLFQLRSFPSGSLNLNLAAGNRVAWLTTKGVNVPLRFNHIQEVGVSTKIRPYFIRRDGRWEICR